MMSRLSFRTKISLTMICALLFLGVTLAIVISRTASRALIDQSKLRGRSSAMYIATRIAEPLLAMDYLRMKDLVDEAFRSGDDIAFVFVLGQAAKPLVHSFTGGFPVNLTKVNAVADDEPCQTMLITTGRELIYDFAVPVVIGNQRLGTVRVGMSQEKIGGAVDRLMVTIFGVTGVSILIAALLGTMLARTMTRRIDLLQRSAEEIAKGNLDIKTLPPPKLSCWRFMCCEKKECPAYGDTRHRCWYVAGDLGPSGTEGECVRRLESCRSCTVYRTNSGDEIERLAGYFDLMAMILKRRMEDLKTLQERMVQAQKLESLGQLAAGVAHELNTPLGIVLGYSQLMLKDVPEESEHYEYLKIQEKHLRICKRIVADLLRFARTTATDKKALDLNEVIDQVVSVVEHTFSLQRIGIERQFWTESPLIFGDREKLQQVFLNLLTNAYDAVESEGRIVITTSIDSENGEVVVSIADTGAGIAPDAMPKIFDPFFTTKAVGKGTGLGLSVTFGIVKDHGGHIEVVSRARSPEERLAPADAADGKEGGTVFTLRFPAYRPDEEGSGQA